MNVLKLLSKINTIQGLATILNDMLWDLDIVNKENKRQFGGILALAETIEKSLTEIKNSYEGAIKL